MASAANRFLVIADGGLPALTAALLCPEPDEVVLWVPPLGSPSIDLPGCSIGPRHRRAVEMQADLLALRGVEIAPWPGGGPGPGTKTRPVELPTAAVLLAAVQRASRLSCGVVVWPVVCGERTEDLAIATDRARLVTRLASLPPIQGEATTPMNHTVRVAIPLADLSRAEVADLALDLDGPLESVWWRLGTQAGEEPWDEPAGQLRLLWEGALQEAARERGAAWAGPG